MKMQKKQRAHTHTHFYAQILGSITLYCFIWQCMKTTFPLHAEHSCTMNAYIAPTYIPVHSIALVSSTSNYNGVHVHCW